MKKSQFIIDAVRDKYSEYLEMAGDDSPALLTDILACLLAREIEQNEYYKECLKKNDRIKI